MLFARQIFRELGFNLEPAKVQQMIGAIDTDHDGGIEFAEFLRIMVNRAPFSFRLGPERLRRPIC